ncbi:MAG: discoidin domain-containing protein [Eubacterium sp.]|nr:discoidin domain-containing protein [Eubacterium sp.]
MRFNQTMKRLMAYICVVVITVASMAGYQAKVSAAAPDGFNDLTEEKWHPLGETVDTTIGDDAQPASIWNVYTGNSWSGVVASVKDGKDDQDTVSIYVEKAANEQWGLQLGRVFKGHEAGKQYAYRIDYTIDGAAAKWIGVATADTKGEVKVIKALGSLVGQGKTFKVIKTAIFDPSEEELTKYVSWLETDRNLAFKKTASVSSHKEGTGVGSLTDGVWDKWNGNYEGIHTPGYFEVDLGQEYAASSIDQVVVWFRNGSNNLYPSNGFDIQFGNLVFDTVSKVTKMPAGADGTQADGSQYMVATTLDKENLKGNVRKVRINIAQSLGWGAQVTEIAVFSENPQGPVEVKPADNPAKVNVSSEPSKDFTGNIKFNITAGENQDGYKYAVFVDNSETASFTDCVAGKDYTITGVLSGKHTVKVISIYNGGYSTGLVSDEVVVSTKLDGYVALDTEDWHPMDTETQYTISDANKPASEWNIYTGNSWSGIVASAKGGKDGEDTISVYVEKAANQEWGLQLGKIFTGLESGKTYAYQIEYEIDGVSSQWSDTAIADAEGNIKVIKALGSIVGAGKIFTVTKTEISEPSANAASVDVSSQKSQSLTGEIKFQITAGENQENYKYTVYLDNETTPSLTDCVAGRDYTITGVTSGKHTIKVVSTNNGFVSAGLVSPEVEVKTVLDDFTDYTKNFAYMASWELMGGQSSEGEGSITNGVVSGDDYATPTKGTDGSYFIIDMGEECNVADIDSIYTCYRIDVGGCYPGDGGMLIEYSTDKENWTKVSTISQAEFNKQHDAQKTAPFGILADVSGVNEGTVRYVKVSCPKAVGYGMQVTEIAILGNVPESMRPHPPVAPTGLSNKKGENIKDNYNFTWEAVDDSVTYNLYVNDNRINSEPITTTSYNAFDYFALQPAGKYIVSVTAVEAKAGLESEKISIEYENAELKPTVSSDGNYMGQQNWKLYVGDWAYCDGELTQSEGNISGSFVTTGGNWNGGEWGIQATSEKIIVNPGVEYTYSADISATKDMVVRIQFAEAIEEIQVKAGEKKTYKKSFKADQKVFDFIWIFGGGETGEVKDVDFTVSNHRIEVKKDEATTKEVPTTTKEIHTTKETPTAASKKITVPKASVKSATKKKAAKKVKLTLKKLKGVKYQVQISKSKKFSKKNILVKKTMKKVRFTLTSKKIKNKKKLYVRVRAIKVVKGKTYTGKWSKTKKVKVKK